MADQKSSPTETGTLKDEGTTSNPLSPSSWTSSATNVEAKPKRKRAAKSSSTSAPSVNKEPFAIVERFREDIQKVIGKLHTQGHVEAADLLRSIRKAIDTNLPEAKAEANKRAEEQAYREADREIRANA